MRKALALAGVFGFAVALPANPLFAQITDGSFEVQGPAAIAGNPGYCYGGGAAPGLDCAVDTPWESFSGGGFQIETNSAWPGTDTPAGEYYAFIQNGGSVNQSFTVGADGMYVLSFLEAGRDGTVASGDQTYEVLIAGSPVYSGSTTTAQPFTAITTDPFMLLAGTYQLSFHGTTFSGDQTAYIDNVVLSAAQTGVPEPSTWAMLLFGFGAVGLALRRRKTSAPAAQVS